jgi:hypothetical protein
MYKSTKELLDEVLEDHFITFISMAANQYSISVAVILEMLEDCDCKDRTYEGDDLNEILKRIINDIT